MASDTVPAAVPGPNDPPHSTAPTAPQDGAQQPGGLAGLLAPVGPARTAAFTLDPETSGSDAVAGTSSSAYQNTETVNSDGGSSKNPGQVKQEKSVVRAWLLAGAERWRKGADARNKRLDIKKAKVQARQVKETVTVNRTEGVGGAKNSGSGSGNSGGGAGKSLTSKTNSGSQKSNGTGPKNNPGPSSSGKQGGKPTDSPSGNRSGGGGRGDSAGRGNSGGTPGAGKGNSGSTGKDRTSPVKQPPGSTTTPRSSDKTTPKKTDTPGRTHTAANDKTSSGKPGAGTPGKDTGPTKHTPKPSKASEAGTAPAKPPKDKVSLDKPGRKDRKQPTIPGQDRGEPGKPGRDRDHLGKTGKDSHKDSHKGREDSRSDRKPHDKTNTRTGTVPAPRINLQPSREAGYRDGTRIGRVVAHTQAWRDGYRDGRTDTAQAAAADKARLDKAREDRKNARPHPDKDRPVTQPASSADYQPATPPKPTHAPGPQPVPVTGIDATHIHLGDGAARPHVSRREVRTLRGFQQRIQTKTDAMTGITEATRVLEQHAQEQAKQVTQLLEQARGVEGGDKLVTALTRLAETAQVQVSKAEQVHQRALRAGEACQALSANTETRYGGIYQAVVDSPETSPAEMRYYREMETTSA